MLTAVDEAPFTRRQKLKLYRLGICPRLNWLLTNKWVPDNLDREKPGGFCYEILEEMVWYDKTYKPQYPTHSKSQEVLISQPFPLSTRSSKSMPIPHRIDPTVRCLVEKNLESEIAFLIRKKSKPAVEV